MAPEVYAGEEYTKSCDVFGLGCILYWLISAQCPYQAPDPLLRLETILTGKLDLHKLEKFDKVSPLCKDILTRMLDPNPIKRCSISFV